MLPTIRILCALQIVQHDLAPDAGRADPGIEGIVPAGKDHDGEIRVTVEGDGDRTCIAVSNAGDPLSTDALNALFDPLRRGSNAASKGEHTSLGLGLFIVREIATAHGGDVTARVEDGRTIFVITLPRQDVRMALQA